MSRSAARVGAAPKTGRSPASRREASADRAIVGIGGNDRRQAIAAFGDGVFRIAEGDAASSKCKGRFLVGTSNGNSRASR